MSGADGVRFGIDWGKARIGIAACNRGTRLAYPVATVAAGRDEFAGIAELAHQYEADLIYVGLPLSLSGERGPAAQAIMAKARVLATTLPGISIRLVDERMSTVTASRSLGAAGRRSRQQRAVIDQAAAVEILQRAIDVEERDGAPAGELVKEEQ